MAELEELAASADAAVAATVIQKRERPNPATYIGQGKLEEIRQMCENLEANVLIFDGELTPSQQRNIEKLTDVKVVDRTELILDIFARRARSSEGKLQVELAQLNYRLSRLGGRRHRHKRPRRKQTRKRPPPHQAAHLCARKRVA